MRTIGSISLCSLILFIGCAKSEVASTGTGDAASTAPAFQRGAMDMMSAIQRGEPFIEHNTESYDHIDENEFVLASQQPLSTFSIDVDTASYANVRRYLLNQGELPPAGAVRIEELVNYFKYDYATPSDERPFAVHLEAASCPWNTDHRIVRVGLKGREVSTEHRPPANLVFLVDVSGSMDSENKLPLVKSALELVVEQMRPDDRIAIAVYASASGMVLPGTSGKEKEKILTALDRLTAGGSTNGGEGIQLAYSIAEENMVPQGINRVILCTDGDFNVGVTNEGALVKLIKDMAETGVSLSVLGFGIGNLKDSTMEKLADNGNGNYAYIDSLTEARKVFVEQLSGTLLTIAKDVKIQVDFNPAQVQAYRLVGYENRMLQAEDFQDDTRDAGEIGSGHTVTAIYEIVPPGVDFKSRDVTPSKYQTSSAPSPGRADNVSNEMLTVRLRYKLPDEHQSVGFDVPFTDEGLRIDSASANTQFAVAVAMFGMLLRGSKHAGDSSFDKVAELAAGSVGSDTEGYRHEFISLVRKAQSLSQAGNSLSAAGAGS